MRLGLVSSLFGFFTGMLIVAVATGVVPLSPARADIEAMMGVGVDLPGNDLQHFTIGTPDPALCRRACDQNNQCVGWTFVKPGVQGPAAVCWLKSKLATTAWSQNAISGVKANAGAAGPGVARVDNDMMLGVNFAGADIESIKLSASNPALCKQICNSRADCKAWTFVKIGSQGPTAMCWIKNAVPATSQSNATISGLGNGGRNVLPPVRGGNGTGTWGVWASASGGRWNDPCAIQYNAAQIANNRYDNNPGYRRVRTRDSQSQADLDINHFGRYHQNQPDGVVKMVACDPNVGGNTGGNNSGTVVLPNIAGTWYREGDRSRPASVGQSGERLTFTNELKPPMSSRGRFLGPREVVAEDWEGGLRGTLSNDGRRISWANGSTWQR